MREYMSRDIREAKYKKLQLEQIISNAIDKFIAENVEPITEPLENIDDGLIKIAQ